ncbi:MAG: acyl-CoA dehydrogenase family protein, partial [Thaumarchaeota archaeon]|nr:acyl-CoA dehydrogenase family protein [Nitrososphaerota archaeon]
MDRVCKEIRPIEDRCYLEHRFDGHVRQLFGEAHLLGLPISRRYGDGQGTDMVTYALALERVGREGTGVRTFFSGHTSLGMLTLQKWGDEKQKERYLIPGTKGEKVLAFALTEPEAGSDPASLRTGFEPRGDDFVISGQK